VLYGADVDELNEIRAAEMFKRGADGWHCKWCEFDGPTTIVTDRLEHYRSHRSAMAQAPSIIEDVLAAAKPVRSV
jgi:hypothetical protein